MTSALGALEASPRRLRWRVGMKAVNGGSINQLHINDTRVVMCFGPVYFRDTSALRAVMEKCHRLDIRQSVGKTLENSPGRYRLTVENCATIAETCRLLVNGRTTALIEIDYEVVIDPHGRSLFVIFLFFALQRARCPASRQCP